MQTPDTLAQHTPSPTSCASETLSVVTLKSLSVGRVGGGGLLPVQQMRGRGAGTAAGVLYCLLSARLS